MAKKTIWSRRRFLASTVLGTAVISGRPPVAFGSHIVHKVRQDKLRVPITMCHGITDRLTHDRFEQYLKIAHELEFTTINYDQLYLWLTGAESLPERPLMIDVDHPVASVAAEMFPLMQKYGFRGNLFVNTGYFQDVCGGTPIEAGQSACATWDQIRDLMMSGWTIGGHTHTHPNLSELSLADPTGEQVRAEMETNNALLEQHLGISPEYFAFTGNSTGTTWSSVADLEAKMRYKLGRLWIIGSNCEIDGKIERYADFVDASGPDEADGGPPFDSRYITRDTPLFRLPSMELERLLYAPEALRRYLLGALG